MGDPLSGIPENRQLPQPQEPKKLSYWDKFVALFQRTKVVNEAAQAPIKVPKASRTWGKVLQDLIQKITSCFHKSVPAHDFHPSVEPRFVDNKEELIRVKLFKRSENVANQLNKRVAKEENETFELDFHALVTQPEGPKRKGNPEPSILASEWQNLKPTQKEHPERFSKDFNREMHLVVAGESIPSKDLEKVEQQILGVINATSRNAAVELSEQQKQKLRYQIEDVTNQWLNGADISWKEEHLRNDSPMGYQFLSEKYPNAEGYEGIVPAGASSYTITSKNNTIVITALDIWKIISEDPKNQGYDGRKIELVIDLTKLDPQLLLSTPNCVAATLTRHGFREKIEDIQF